MKEFLTLVKALDVAALALLPATEMFLWNALAKYTYMLSFVSEWNIDMRPRHRFSFR